MVVGNLISNSQRIAISSDSLRLLVFSNFRICYCFCQSFELLCGGQNHHIHQLGEHFARCLLKEVADWSLRPKMSLFEFQVVRYIAYFAKNSSTLHAEKIHKLISFLSIREGLKKTVKIRSG